MERRLGIRTFIYYIIKGALPGLLLLFVATIILATKDTIGPNLISQLNMSLIAVNRLYIYLVGGIYLLSLLVIVFGILINWLTYINLRFSIGEYSFKIHTGILSKTIKTVPYKQIEDVSIIQSIFDRIFGLAKIVVLTSANDEETRGESVVEINVIDYSIAKYLQEELEKRGGIQITKSL